MCKRKWFFMEFAELLPSCFLFPLKSIQSRFLGNNKVPINPSHPFNLLFSTWQISKGNLDCTCMTSWHVNLNLWRPRQVYTGLFPMERCVLSGGSGPFYEWRQQLGATTMRNIPVNFNSCRISFIMQFNNWRWHNKDKLRATRKSITRFIQDQAWQKAKDNVRLW
jgi:hypothetical protein